MSSSSTPSKVNCLVIKTLHFRGVRGDLQERPYLFFPMPIPFFPSTKTSILCSKCRKWGFLTTKAHKNGNFVLEKPEIEGSEGLGAHGLCGRVANSAVNGCRLAESWPRTGRDLVWGLVWGLAGRGQMLRHRTKREEGDRKVPPSSVCRVRCLSLSLQVPPLWSCTTGTALA